MNYLYLIGKKIRQNRLKISGILMKTYQVLKQNQQVENPSLI